MELLFDIFNAICWICGIGVVSLGLIAICYEMGGIMLAGLRQKLRNNQRFMAWLENQCEKERRHNA